MSTIPEVLPNPETLTRRELRHWISRTNDAIETTASLTVAMSSAGYLQELYDELASRPNYSTHRSPHLNGYRIHQERRQ